MASAVEVVLFNLTVEAGICASLALLTTWVAIVVALPALVTSPVKLAFVTTVVAAMVPLPVVASEAPVPTSMTAPVLVPEVKELNADDPPPPPVAVMLYGEASVPDPLMVMLVPAAIKPLMVETVPELPVMFVWSPVFMPFDEPLKFDPVMAPDAATLDGVIAPKVNVIVGVVVGFATVAEIPFAGATATLVTVPVLAPAGVA